MTNKNIPHSRSDGIRVLHVIVGLGVGGAELMLKRLVESYRDDSTYRHEVVSLTDIGVVGGDLRAVGVTVRAIGMKSVLEFPIALWRLSRVVKYAKPDIVQTWMYHADFLGGLAARLNGIDQVIWGIRTTDVDAAGATLTTWIRKICALTSGLVPRVIVCAAEASKRAHIAIGYDARRMAVIPNGFDLHRLVATAEQRADMRRQLGFDERTPVVGYLGRFHPAKDQANFVRAAGLLAANRADVRFLLVGRGLATGNKQLMQWIIETGYADRFVLLGERKDVPICLSAMDIFGLSSLTEGFPNVVGEAMAMGLPCVVTDVGDAAMLVADTGIVVPRADSAAFAAGLLQLLALPNDERLALGRRAHRRIADSFSMDNAKKQFDSIYQTVANNKRQS